MTIRNENDELVCECNDCGAELYSRTAGFKSFIVDIKDAGWRIRKDGDEWIHLCPCCIEET